MRDFGDIAMGKGAMREDIPTAPMGTGTRIRLWLIFNLYLFVAAGLALALGGLAFFVPGWLAVPMGLGVLPLGQLAWSIGAKHHKKLRAVGRAMTRIEHGTFEPGQVVRYCGDPCSRLVAHEILRRAGYGRAERRRIVQEGTTANREADRQLVLVDRARGVLVEVNGARVETHQLEGWEGGGR